MKTCSTCKIEKLEDSFHIKKSNKHGLDYDCKKCANKKIRDRRTLNHNSVTYKYEHTKKGKIMRTYRNMLSRVKGVVKNKQHLYMGLEIIDKELFYSWSLENAEFHTLFDKWEQEEYTLRLSPSIDRIDPLKGYVEDNMRWVTQSYNSGNTRGHKPKTI